MKVLLSNRTVLKKFEFSTDFNIFHSRCYVGGKEYTFSRHCTNFNWLNTNVFVNNKFIGPGEDPRAFEFLGSPACWCTTAVPEKNGLKFQPYLYVSNSFGYDCIPIRAGHGINIGKNWGPFVYQDEIYFVHEISPFRVVKLQGNVIYEVFTEKVKSEINPIDRYPVIRGGTNGLDIGNGLIMGFCHTNRSGKDNLSNSQTDSIHKPDYAWTVDMQNNKVEILSVTYNWEDEFKVIDPTSFFIKDGQRYLMTTETNHHWGNHDQSACICLYNTTIA